ncbi:hypothetical protein GQ607_013856 [Colletotrichum asianum]|uniref:Uncharacterized protein n=1 Tax=Colletotrichum asianum TaxID=702518 RepID=A0A8H3W421_9PEZI|nr:hypothetical protein GQ607_013856 [Colletotrichum asianum]
MDSRDDASPEVFLESETMNDLIKIKCDHPRLSKDFFDQEDSRMVSASCPKCHDRMVTMATLFLQTCPGSWDRGFGPLMRGMLRRAIQTNESLGTVDIVDAIAFRWKAAQLVDRIVRELDLPVPSNKTCIIWSKYDWTLSDREEDQRPYFGHQYRRIWAAFRDGDLPEPSLQQGPPFVLLQEYLSAAITEARLSEQKSLALAKLVLEHVHHARQCDPDLNYQYESDEA